MAKMEQYIFNVDANTDNAVKKLQEINRLMNDIERVRNKGTDDYYTTNQKDMDKSMRSMSQLTHQYNLLNKELDALKQNMRMVSDKAVPPSGASKQQIKEIRQIKAESDKQFAAAQRQQKALQKTYEETLNKHRETVTFQQNYSKNFKHIFSSKDLRNLPTDDLERAQRIVGSMANDADGVSSKLNDVIAKIRDVNKLERRSESQSRRAQASRYMSYQQSSSFSKDVNTVNHDYVKERESNLAALTHLGQERSRLFSNIKEIETKDSVSQEDIDKKIAMQQTVQAIDEEWESRMELNRVLERTIKNMKSYNEQVQGVEVKPERGTFKGMVYERAPAIGLALGGAFGAVWGGLYNKGAGINRGMRDDVISVGQRTDSTEWRSNIRDNAFNLGLQDRLGFTGQEMLDFQNNYLSNAGYSGMDDLNSAATAQAKFSRNTGMDAQTTKQFFDSVFSTGAVNGSQVKDVQNAFLGAIKNSGMEGREKDQINALEGILESVKQGRSMTNSEVMNVMGLQSILASSGNRALSGGAGGQLLQELNEGIRQGFSNPMVRLAFGQGTEYQGLEGRFALRQRMDEGITNSRNITDIAKIAESYMPNSEDGQNEVFASFVEEGLGTNITAEQAKGLMDLYRQGALTEENINSVIQGDKEAGETAANKRFEEYQNSHAAAEAESDAVTEKQAANLYDMGDAVREANSALGGLPAVVYATIVSIAALGAAAATSAGMFGLGRGVRRYAAGSYGGRGRGGRGGGGTPPTGGGAGGGPVILGPDGRPLPPSGGPNGGGNGTPPTGGGGWRERIGGWFGAGGGGNGTPPTGGGSRFGGLMRGAGGVLSKSILPLSALLGIGTILAAPDGQKAEATGSVIGGIGGGIAGGAAAGAALGSVVPGFGTAIGGIVGGIGGGIAGSSLGGWIGGLFGADEASAAEKPKEETVNEVDQQVDRENTNRKDQAENKRSDNIAGERENLNFYERLLDKAQQLLQQAQAQGGIFGAGGSVGGNTSTGGAATQLSGNDNAEKIWNFFAEKGFSPEAISGIMGNLQEESGLDPTKKQDLGGGKIGKGRGIMQWETGGRWDQLTSWAQGEGRDPLDLQTQLDYMWKEMTGGDSTGVGILNKKYGGMDGLKNANNVNWATDAFQYSFERAGKTRMNDRYASAEKFYDKYGSAQWTSSPATASSTKSEPKEVKSTITVNVKADESVADKVKDSKEMQATAQRINSMVYGSMNYYSKEMRTI